jgi:predicted MFS family arabinose efflux permease
MNLIANVTMGIADTGFCIVVTTIIFTEFEEKASFYYVFFMVTWAGGYVLGPIIPFLTFDLFGYAGVFFFITGLIVFGALFPAVYMLPVRLNDSEPKDSLLIETERKITYWDILSSYRTTTFIVIFVFAQGPLVHGFGLITTKLVSLGITENKAGLAFTIMNFCFILGSFSLACLSQKIDRRLVIIGIYFFCGVANFILGPSPWLNFPESPYIILIGFSINGFLLGGISTLAVPEIMAGVN